MSANGRLVTVAAAKQASILYRSSDDGAVLAIPTAISSRGNENLVVPVSTLARYQSCKTKSAFSDPLFWDVTELAELRPVRGTGRFSEAEFAHGELLCTVGGELVMAAICVDEYDQRIPHFFKLADGSEIAALHAGEVMRFQEWRVHFKVSASNEPPLFTWQTNR